MHRPGRRALALLAAVCLPSCGSGPTGADPAEADWGPPQVISQHRDARAFVPRVVVDAAGNASAFWIEFGTNLPSRTGIWTSLFRPGQGWAAAQELVPSGDIGFDAAVDAAGKFSFAWVERSGLSGFKIYSRQWDARAGWSAAQHVSDDTSDPANGGDAFISAPSLAVAPDGRAHMVWRQTAQGTSRLWIAQYVPGRAWEPPVVLDEWIGNASRPEVALDLEGRAVAVWRAHPPFGDFETSEIRATVLVPGAGWSPVEVIDTPLRASPPDPLPLMMARGDAFVLSAPVTLTGARGMVWAIRYIAGRGWQPPAPIADTGARVLGAASQPALAADDAGNVTAVWIQYAGVIPGVWSNRYEAGRGWTGALRLDTRDEPTSAPRVAATPGGHVVAVWLEGGNVNDASPTTEVWSRRFVPGAGWGEAVRVNALPDPVEGADVGVDAQGNAIAVWTQGPAWVARFAGGR
jgi:hypothetical protein